MYEAFGKAAAPIFCTVDGIYNMPDFVEKEIALLPKLFLLFYFIINFKPGNPTPLGMGRRALFLQKNKKISYFFTLS